MLARTTVFAAVIFVGAAMASAQPYPDFKDDEGGCFKHETANCVYMCLTTAQWNFLLQKNIPPQWWRPKKCTVKVRSGSGPEISTCADDDKQAYGRCTFICGNKGDYALNNRSSTYNKRNSGAEWPPVKCEIK